MPKINVEDLNGGPKTDISKLSKDRKDWLGIFGNTWAPAKTMPGTCEACVWGSGQHVPTCVQLQARPESWQALRTMMDLSDFPEFAALPDGPLTAATMSWPHGKMVYMGFGRGYSTIEAEVRDAQPVPGGPLYAEMPWSGELQAKWHKANIDRDSSLCTACGQMLFHPVHYRRSTSRSPSVVQPVQGIK